METSSLDGVLMKYRSRIGLAAWIAWGRSLNGGRRGVRGDGVAFMKVRNSMKDGHKPRNINLLPPDPRHWRVLIAALAFFPIRTMPQSDRHS